MTSNNNNIKTVLPASGSGSPANTADQKSYKQELKNRIATLKLLQKDTQKNLSAAQKELNKLSGSKKKTTPRSFFKDSELNFKNKELKIVKKKGKNSKNK